MIASLDECKKPFHKHLMIRAYADHAPTDMDETRAWIDSLILWLDMKKLQGPYISYVEAEGNRGLTAVAMIETSHIAFHIWDEQKPSLLQFDVYTCGPLHAEATIKEVQKYFKIVSGEYVLYDREHAMTLIAEGKIA